MICPDCRGLRTIRRPILIIGELCTTRRQPPARRDTAAERIVEEPCPGCGGSGIASCCEGAVGLAADVTNTGGCNCPPDRCFAEEMNDIGQNSASRCPRHG